MLKQRYSYSFSDHNKFEILSQPSAMIRRKMPSHRIPCQRQNCCGLSKEQDNFLSVTSRGHNNSQSHSKHKTRQSKSAEKKQKKKSKSVTMLQQSYHLIIEENKQLHAKLDSKKTKIDSLKKKIKQLEGQLKNNQIGQGKINESSDRKDYKIIHQSQKLAKQTLQKYRRLQEEYAKYREVTENKLDKLKQEKQKLLSAHRQKVYNKQLEQLKNQLHKFKQEQLTTSSMKNLHDNFTPHEQNYKLEVSTLKLSLANMKNQNGQLREQNKGLSFELHQTIVEGQQKQGELKRNLDTINHKILTWEQQYHELRDQLSHWKQIYNELLEKYKKKKQKYRMNNEEWAIIFREFLQQIEKLKHQLDLVSARNIKLIKMYGQN